VKKLYMRL